MSDCCYPISKSPGTEKQRICPRNGSKGKSVFIITLKSLLKPAALEQLDSQQFY